MKNLSISKKIGMILFVVIGLNIVIGLSGYFSMNKISSHIQDVSKDAKILEEQTFKLNKLTSTLKYEVAIAKLTVIETLLKKEDVLKNIHYINSKNKIKNTLKEINAFGKKYNKNDISKTAEILRKKLIAYFLVLETLQEEFEEKAQYGIEVLNEEVKPIETDMNNAVNKVSVNINKRFNDRINNVTISLDSISKIVSTAGIINIVLYSFSIILSLLIGIFIMNNIVSSINKFQNGIIQFFKYLNKETNTIIMLDDESVDEIGTMSKIVNKNIVKTKKIIEEDQKVIEAVKDAVIIAKTGILNKKIHISTSNEALEELKVGFNELLDVVSTKVSDDLNKISEALEYYHNLDFRYQIDNASGEVASGLNSLAKTINQMLHDNNTNGIVLQNNSMELLNNVEQLSNSSNEAAESLKETAIALDEVTSNISQNTAKVLDMANYSSEVKRAVEKSEKLANQTTISMDEINEQVLLINESIIVIDKIAFQTNILSLNAAVEAATAGEAGKGFAVVAQEVRNLASRSAAAANEIKALVENATSKANDGKIITNTMVDGYKLLNESISKTITLILDVETSSKEQQIGIEHINNSIIQLDKQTQQNANVANETKNIATQTQDMANTIIEDVNKKKF